MKERWRHRARAIARPHANQESERGLLEWPVTASVVAANKWRCGGAHPSVADVSGTKEGGNNQGTRLAPPPRRVAVLASLPCAWAQSVDKQHRQSRQASPSCGDDSDDDDSNNDDGRRYHSVLCMKPAAYPLFRPLQRPTSRPQAFCFVAHPTMPRTTKYATAASPQKTPIKYTQPAPLRYAHGSG